VPQPPSTRETLNQRLPNAADVEAWDQFVAIYEPLLFRLARDGNTCGGTIVTYDVNGSPK
jgi:hypothetical protein